LKFIIKHPLNKDKKIKSITNFFRWQLGSRILKKPVIINFVNQSRLIVKKGMTGATGTIYTGLYEFEEMSFVLHFLRKDDVMFDIGANIGLYTILAGAVVGAKCFAFEPIPDTFKHLIDNVNINGIYEKVKCYNIGIADKNDILKFTSNLDTGNHVVFNKNCYRDTNIIDVPVKKLDGLIPECDPLLIKIDVEGFELQVLKGAEKTLRSESLLAVIMETFGKSDLDKYMSKYGFKPFVYDPFNKELSSFSSKKFFHDNTLYIKNIEKVNERIKSSPKFLINDKKI
jgi:FkbM family methyltransferase